MRKYASDDDYDDICSCIGEAATKKLYEAFAGSAVYFPVRNRQPEYKDIATLLDQGFTVDRIARKLGHPRSTIHKMIHEHKQQKLDKKTVWESKQKKNNYDYMCSCIGETTTKKLYKAFAGSTVYFPVRNRRPEYKDIADLLDQGFSVVCIARRLSYSRASIYRIIREHKQQELDKGTV